MNDILKQAINTYNKIASIYAKYTYEKLLQFQLTKFISLLPGKKVLDAGCGSGRDVSYFLEEGLDAMGIDLSEGMIEEAKKRVKKGNFKIMNFLDLKFKDKTFDGIWSMAGFLHTSREDLKKALKEFYRVLKEEGILYIAVVEGEGEREIKKKKYQNEPRTYVFYKKEELEKYLNESNFKIISSEINSDKGKLWLEAFAKKSTSS